MAFPKTCTNIVNGKLCGGEVYQDGDFAGLCSKFCGADYNEGDIVGDGAAPPPAASAAATATTTTDDDTSRSGSHSRSGNRSRTGSRNGGSRIGTDRTVAETLGIVGAKRKTREGSSSSQRIRTAVGRGYVVIPEIPKSDARALIKPKYLKAAREFRTCFGTADRSHDAFVLISPQADGTIRQRGFCPAKCADGKPCKKPFEFRDKATLELELKTATTELERLKANRGDADAIRKLDLEIAYLTGAIPTATVNVPPLPILPETVISGQYKVLGTIAQGGCGFIDILLDLDLSGTSGPEKTKVEQFAIAKTQLATANSENDRKVSMAEKAMLANLRHPSIASVLGFKEYNGMPLILMEWIDGKTVADIWKERAGPLTVAETLAYVLDMCQSMSFLHSHGVINPDLKPDNFMQWRDKLKQIDAGGWLLETDLESSVTSTEGFAPREVDDPNVPCSPTRWSDIYSLGRIAFVMAHFQRPPKQATADWEIGKLRWALPDTSEAFENYPSYEALVRRACHPKPEGRFASVEEFEEQCEGVLREVVAIDAIRDGKPNYRIWQSNNFNGDISGGSQELSIRMLPPLKIDTSDRAAAEIETILNSSSDTATMFSMFEEAVAKYPKSDEAKLRRINHMIDMGKLDEAENNLKLVAADDAFDWRRAWYFGKLKMAQKDFAGAMDKFDTVVSYLPGEPAAKMAAGMAAEMAGDLIKATNQYDLVTKVEPSLTPAAFGQARCMREEGNRDGAVEVLCRVPVTSIARVPAQIAAAITQVHAQPTKPGEAELVKAAGFLLSVQEESFAWHHAAATYFTAAAATGIKNAKVKVLGTKLLSGDLRDAADREFLIAARLADSEEATDQLVEKALEVRTFWPIQI